MGERLLHRPQFKQIFGAGFISRAVMGFLVWRWLSSSAMFGRRNVGGLLPLLLPSAPRRSAALSMQACELGRKRFSPVASTAVGREACLSAQCICMLAQSSCTRAHESHRRALPGCGVSCDGVSLHLNARKGRVLREALEERVSMPPTWHQPYATCEATALCRKMAERKIADSSRRRGVCKCC